MANTKSAAKRTRQSRARSTQNVSIITALKTQQKKIETAIQEKKKENAQSMLNTFFSSLDKAAKKGVVHKNSVNRKKASVTKALSTI